MLCPFCDKPLRYSRYIPHKKCSAHIVAISVETIEACSLVYQCGKIFAGKRRVWREVGGPWGQREVSPVMTAKFRKVMQGQPEVNQRSARSWHQSLETSCKAKQRSSSRSWQQRFFGRVKWGQQEVSKVEKINNSCDKNQGSCNILLNIETRQNFQRQWRCFNSLVIYNFSQLCTKAWRRIVNSHRRWNQRNDNKKCVQITCANDVKVNRLYTYPGSSDKIIIL
jgi:hypothetical protein